VVVLKKLTALFSIFAFALNSTAVLAGDEVFGPPTQMNYLKGAEKEVAEQKYQEEIVQFARTLNDNFENPKTKAHSLDTWQMLSQTVDQAELEEIQEIMKKMQAEDTDGEQVETFLNEDLPLRKNYKNNLVLRMVGDYDHVKGHRLQTDFQESFAPNFSRDLKVVPGAHFEILDKDYKRLHTFHREVNSLGFYGKYLVYVERGSYDAVKGVLPVRFIDLEYFKTAIGNGPLPVYTLPVKIDREAEVEIKNGKLVVGKSIMPIEALHFLAKYIYQPFYNIQVAALDSKTYKNAEALLKEMLYYFNESMNTVDADVKNSLERDLDMDSILQNVTQGNPAGKFKTSSLPDSPEFLKAIDAKDAKAVAHFIVSSKEYSSKMLDSNRTMQAARLFNTRLSLFMAQFSSPQPMGSPKILRALAMLAGSVISKDVETFQFAKSSIVNHPYFKFVKFGSYAVAGAAFGSAISEQFRTHLFQMFELTNVVINGTHSYLVHIDYGLNFGRLYNIAVIDSVTGAFKSGIYFTHENFPKFMVGITAVASAAYLSFGIAHIIRNAVVTYSYMKDNLAKFQAKSSSRLEAFKEAFIVQQENERSAYEKLQVMNERERLEGEKKKIANYVKELSEKGFEIKNSDEYTPEETEAIKKIINELEPPTKFKKALNELRTSSAKVLFAASEKLESENAALNSASKAMYRVAQFVEGIKVDKTRDIDTFFKAIKHYMFSYASLTYTIKTLTASYSYVFLARTFLPRPSVWYMTIVYPQFFNIAVKATESEIHNPTIWNGGKESSAKKIGRFRRQSMVDILAMKEWEKAVLPIERIVNELAMEKSIEALFKRLDDPEKILSFFDSTHMVTNLPPLARTRPNIKKTGAPTSGITSLVDPKLKKLSGEERAFFRAYFTKTYDETMRKFVEEFTIKSLPNGSMTRIDEITHMSDSELKRVSAQEVSSLKSITENVELDSYRAKLRKQISSLMDEVTVTSKIKQFAEDASSKLGFMFDRINVNYHHNLINTINPKGTQMSRVKNVDEMLKKPDMVARAVRSDVSELFVTKPLSLITLLAFFSGVTDPVLKPFFPEEMFGDHAWFYMSRYVVLTGWVAGTIQGMMSSSWMTLQALYRAESVGGFDGIPTKKYRELPFWRYQLKATFGNASNRWIDNQTYWTKLVWANVPAVVVLEMMKEFAFMPKLELEALIVSYLFIFATPFLGFNPKLNTGFEVASNWVRTQIPLKYRAHPLALEYINRTIQKKKMVFGFWEHIYQIIEGTASTLFVTMATKEFGTRSFSRLLLNGWSMTELGVLGIRKIGQTFSFIPGVEPVAHACELLISRGDKTVELKGY
jgi:hypothetical protein